MVGGSSVENSVASLERANGLLTCGALAEAAAMFAVLHRQQPEDPDVLHGLGLVALHEGRLAEAREHVAYAAELAPKNAHYLCTLGDIERLRGDLAGAEAFLLRALDLQPESADALNNLGMVFLSAEKFVEAAQLFQLALKYRPALTMAWYNRGVALKELNQLDQAIASYREAITRQPDFVQAHVNLAIALLLDGQLEEGFEEYEWRLKPPLAASRRVSAPDWDGNIVPGGSLVVCAEQGAGDLIQFARYLPFIARQGMRTIVQCRPEMEALMQTVEGVASTYRPDEDLPVHNAQVMMASLPRLFQTRIDKIPTNIPYLRPPFAQVQRWKERMAELGDTIKVGLRWAGNPANSDDSRRSCPLSLFAGIAGTGNMTLVSLQNEPPDAAEMDLAQRLGLVDCSADLKDFTDTAALLANLDLVISVDTAVLHLAGALGRPTWALLRYSPHWPWLLERDDSVWYPGMQLFRQPRPGDWKTVIDHLVDTLLEVMHISRDDGLATGKKDV